MQTAERPWEKYCESLVVGGLVAKRSGLFSSGGLNGVFLSANIAANTGEWDIALQYELYKDGKTGAGLAFAPYRSQMAGQGIMLGVLDALLDSATGISWSDRLSIYRLLMAMALSAVFCLMLVWIIKDFGMLPAAVFAVLTTLSPWLTVFGRNIFWAFFSFYIPAAAVFVFMYNAPERLCYHRKNYLMLFLVVYVAVFIKCFLTGYEYITPALVMIGAAGVYVHFSRYYRFIQLVRMSVVTVVFSVLSVLTSFILLSFQIARVDGSFLSGIRHIWTTFLRQSSGSGEDFAGILRENLKADMLTVMKKYFTGALYKVGDSFSISALEIALFALFLTFMLLRLARTEPDSSKKRRLYALLITLWFSMSAPLSWFIIFKGHSYIHYHLNYVTWYMPYLLLLFVVFGIFLKYSIQYAVRRFQKSGSDGKACTTS